MTGSEQERPLTSVAFRMALHGETPAIVELLPVDVLAHVLHQFGMRGGWEPGDFTKDLIRLLQHADPGNQVRLELGFPEYAWAVRLMQRDTHGIYAELMAQRVTAAAAERRSQG